MRRIKDSNGSIRTEEYEAARAEELLIAQEKANSLFVEIERRNLIRSGIFESQLNSEIYALAKQLFGITTYWHKRIVRSGANTLQPYNENPPDFLIAPDDILFIDLGPVFEGWEADYGRTFVLGSDPMKLKLANDVKEAFAIGKQFFRRNRGLTGRMLFEFVRELGKDAGWMFGGPHAGHLIGEFPHERIQGDKVHLYIHPKNNVRMRELDQFGMQRHWILEIHFVDYTRKIGGFYEELLTLG